MQVRHAKLIDVVGRAAKFGSFTIVPATIELAGTSYSSSFPLGEIPAHDIPPVLTRPLKEQFDVAWVRARIPIVFGFSPEISEQEKTLMSVGFVGVREGANDAIAFECADDYGKTSLVFSSEETDTEAMKELADAFWGLLLSEPNELADFEAQVVHVGAATIMQFGCEHGEPYCHEFSR